MKPHLSAMEAPFGGALEGPPESGGCNLGTDTMLRKGKGSVDGICAFGNLVRCLLAFCPLGFVRTFGEIIVVASKLCGLFGA